jgi:hypothetical protein
MDDLRTSANEEHKKQYEEIQKIVSRQWVALYPTKPKNRHPGDFLDCAKENY